jgi:glycerol-3-phosphate acyltransferase PlsY
VQIYFDVNDAAEGATYPALITFLYALTILAVAGFLISYVLAYRRRYISLGSLVAAIAGAVTVGVTAFLVNDIIPREIAWPATLFIPPDATWLAALCLLVVPLPPFAMLPLTIERQRHG